jgi:hypothetical protein
VFNLFTFVVLCSGNQYNVGVTLNACKIVVATSIQLNVKLNTGDHSNFTPIPSVALAFVRSKDHLRWTI